MQTVIDSVTFAKTMRDVVETVADTTVEEVAELEQAVVGCLKEKGGKESCSAVVGEDGDSDDSNESGSTDLSAHTTATSITPQKPPQQPSKTPDPFQNAYQWSAVKREFDPHRVGFTFQEQMDLEFVQAHLDRVQQGHLDPVNNPMDALNQLNAPERVAEIQKKMGKKMEDAKKKWIDQERKKKMRRERKREKRMEERRRKMRESEERREGEMREVQTELLVLRREEIEEMAETDGNCDDEMNVGFTEEDSEEVKDEVPAAPMPSSSEECALNLPRSAVQNSETAASNTPSDIPGPTAASDSPLEASSPTPTSAKIATASSPAEGFHTPDSVRSRRSSNHSFHSMGARSRDATPRPNSESFQKLNKEVETGTETITVDVVEETNIGDAVRESSEESSDPTSPRAPDNPKAPLSEIPCPASIHDLTPPSKWMKPLPGASVAALADSSTDSLVTRGTTFSTVREMRNKYCRKSEISETAYDQ